MAAYVIADKEVTNLSAYEEYRPRVPGTIEKYDGKYVIRSASAETHEGTWIPKRLVVPEFPSMERAKEWYASPEYKEIRELRSTGGQGPVMRYMSSSAHARPKPFPPPKGNPFGGSWSRA